jgi:UDP-2,4-diacetamido-2,4,6-trideoxy-beta-L-altropyranose hydrolase
MRVVFRADASTVIGTGHLTRSATLADVLRARGADVSFVCREHPGHLIEMLRQRSLPVAVLPPPEPSGFDRDGYAAWVGAPQPEDAEQTIRAIGGDASDWIVVDHYGLDAQWERRMRPRAGRLLVIDDLASHPHECDVLLDQNYSRDSDRRYEGLVPTDCRLLIGPRYALLAPAYPCYRATQPPRDGSVRRVLVYFGGADRSNMTGQALTALSAPLCRHLSVDLVIGTNHPQRQALELQAAARPGTSVHGTRPHLADLMAQADLAIGAGGTTTWERMCLGLPSLVVSLAENQRPTCEALAAAGLIDYAGDVGSVAAGHIHDALVRLLEDRDRLLTLSSRGRRLVDGCGASRVADVMLGRAGDPLVTRHALHEDDARPEGFDTFTFAWIDRCRAEDVLSLRNMPHVTAQMRSQAPISAADHRRFLDAYSQMDRYDFILIDNNRRRSVGAFYITNVGSAPELGKYIGDPEYLGKGVAHRAAQSLIDFCRTRAGLGYLMAVTRRDNSRNIALNTRLGFRKMGADDAYIVMRLEL